MIQTQPGRGESPNVFRSCAGRFAEATGPFHSYFATDPSILTLEYQTCIDCFSESKLRPASRHFVAIDTGDRQAGKSRKDS